MIKIKNYLRILKYKFYLWHIDSKYVELDVDLLCSTMTYKEYLKECEILDYNYNLYKNKIHEIKNK